jgi:hypothetical protein
LEVVVVMEKKNNACMSCDHNLADAVCKMSHRRWKRLDEKATLVIQEVRGCGDWAPMRIQDVEKAA